MFVKYARLALLCFFASVPVACSGGNGSGDPTLTPQSAGKDAQDVNFIGGAGMSSNAEIGAAKIALMKSSNPDVLTFANLMIKDHTNQNDVLAPIGLTIGTPAPSGIGPSMQAVANTLMTLTGTAFDAYYINSEIMGHSMNLDNNYMPELQIGLNGKVVGYAGQFEPQVASHLSQAQTIKAKYNF